MGAEIWRESSSRAGMEWSLAFSVFILFCLFSATSPARLRRFAQSESEDLMGVDQAGPESEDLTYVVDRGYRRGTNRVYVVDSDYGYGGVNALNKVNAKNYRSRYNTYLDSAYVYANGNGANSLYNGYNRGYGSGYGYGLFGTNNGWNGGSDYYSYFGYKPISG